MTEMPEQSSMNNESVQPRQGYSQYQRQTVTLYNTLGLVFMSILAFALLLGLLRQQTRYHELATRFMQQK